MNETTLESIEERYLTPEELLSTDFDMDVIELPEQDNLAWLILSPGFIIFTS